MAPSPQEVQKRWRTCAWVVYFFLLSGYLIYCGFLIQKAYGLSKTPLVATSTDIKRTIKLPYIAVCLNEQDFLSDCGQGYDLEGFESVQPSQLNQGATIDLFLGLADSNYPAEFFGTDPTRSPNRRARTPSTYCRNRQSSAGFCGPSCDSVQVLLAENKAAIEENLVERGVGTYKALANQTGLVPIEVTYRQPFSSSEESAFFKPAEISVLTGDQQRINLCNAESAQCAGAGLDVYYLVTDLDFYILRLRLSGPNLGVAIQQEQNPWLSLLSTLGGAWFLIPLVFGMIFVSVESESSERFQLINRRWIKDNLVTPLSALFVKFCRSRVRKPSKQFDDMDLQLRAMEHDGRDEPVKV
ncbi:hypothetical protein KFL_001460170 [Klebsormidium nitens]|uniref:Uncharacterized protein n=1 Tax=Klebsormidium nitens TaxID=105231 RepID=A0A1Y1I095_KLENI|nr:hypothetical protein KFL_001460170 [Klebsormidium nitens]|eukprot:GAQ83392.1 hypothetical protein KFL_001460170 [Klebsormidium nitens]